MLHYTSNNEIFYFNFLITNIVKFKLYDYTVNTFKHTWCDKNETEN